MDMCQINGHVPPSKGRNLRPLEDTNKMTASNTAWISALMTRWKRKPQKDVQGSTDVVAWLQLKPPETPEGGSGVS